MENSSEENRGVENSKEEKRIEFAYRMPARRVTSAMPFRYVVMSNVVSCEVTCGAVMWLCATCDVTETLLQIKSNALTRK